MVSASLVDLKSGYPEFLMAPLVQAIKSGDDAVLSFERFVFDLRDVDQFWKLDTKARCRTLVRQSAEARSSVIEMLSDERLSKERELDARLTNRLRKTEGSAKMLSREVREIEGLLEPMLELFHDDSILSIEKNLLIGAKLKYFASLAGSLERYHCLDDSRVSGLKDLLRAVSGTFGLSFTQATLVAILAKDDRIDDEGIKTLVSWRNGFRILPTSPTAVIFQ